MEDFYVINYACFIGNQILSTCLVRKYLGVKKSPFFSLSRILVFWSFKDVFMKKFYCIYFYKLYDFFKICLEFITYTSELLIFINCFTYMCVFVCIFSLNPHFREKLYILNINNNSADPLYLNREMYCTKALKIFWEKMTLYSEFKLFLDDNSWLSNHSEFAFWPQYFAEYLLRHLLLQLRSLGFYSNNLNAISEFSLLAVGAWASYFILYCSTSVLFLSSVKWG